MVISFVSSFIAAFYCWCCCCCCRFKIIIWYVCCIRLWFFLWKIIKFKFVKDLWPLKKLNKKEENWLSFLNQMGYKVIYESCSHTQNLLLPIRSMTLMHLTFFQRFLGFFFYCFMSFFLYFKCLSSFFFLTFFLKIMHLKFYITDEVLHNSLVVNYTLECKISLFIIYLTI
jgi:hypothetical protein